MADYGECPRPDMATAEKLWEPDDWFDLIYGSAQWGWDQAHAAAQRLAAEERQKGADEELEACVRWLGMYGLGSDGINRLHVARRPPAPTLRERALAALREQLGDRDGTPLDPDCVPALRLALRALEGGDD